MQFSMIFEAQLTKPTRERERQLMHDCVEQAVLAEEMGFDRIWAVEHHALLRYAHMSAPEIFLTWVAARTSRIRIGHGVVCLPFKYNHPIRVAERMAMLDILSNGRLDVGAGRGATLQEMSLCGVDPDTTYQEMEESLGILGSVWREEKFEWHGPLLDIEPHPVLPRPVQDPHPPLYLACTKESTVELAADYGIGSLVLGFAGPEQVAGLRSTYDAAIAARTGEQFVSTVTNDYMSALCPTIVLDDAEKAFQIGARGQRFFSEAIHHWYQGGPEPSEDEDHSGDQRAEAEAAKERWVALLHESQIPVTPGTVAQYNVDHAYGDASRAIEYVEALVDAGVDEIMCLIQMGTVPQDVCMETIRHWGETVIPHFRGAS